MRRSLKTHPFYDFSQRRTECPARASTCGFCLVQPNIGGAFCPNFIPRIVGEGWGRVCHPYRPKDQCRSHFHSNSYHQKGYIIFQVIFSMTDLMDLIKLLPWCTSSAVPFCHICEMLTSAIWWGKDTATTTATPDPEGSLAPVLRSSPVHPSGTLPLVPLLQDFPL